MVSRTVQATLAALAAATLALAQGHPRIDPERVLRVERQEIALSDFEASGYILDIGGGGEGIIGQLKPTQTIAIDLSKRELEEAPGRPALKIVMDATDLKFLDKTFATSTAFFSLMYMPPETQEKALKEVYRVLQPGGRFLIWDAILPEKFTDPEKKKDVVMVPITVKMPAQEVKTGYGVFLAPAPHDVAYWVQLAEKTGFKVASKAEKDRNFFLELRKP